MSGRNQGYHLETIAPGKTILRKNGLSMTMDDILIDLKYLTRIQGRILALESTLPKTADDVLILLGDKVWIYDEDFVGVDGAGTWSQEEVINIANVKFFNGSEGTHTIGGNHLECCNKECYANKPEDI